MMMIMMHRKPSYNKPASPVLIPLPHMFVMYIHLCFATYRYYWSGVSINFSGQSVSISHIHFITFESDL